MQYAGASGTETVTYGYDNLLRKSSVVDVVNGSTLTTTYAYDQAGGNVTIDPSTGAKTNVTGDTDGHLTQVAGPQGTINYIYDAPTGRLVETWTGTTYSSAITDTRYGYDALGHLASTSIVKQNGATTSPARIGPATSPAEPLGKAWRVAPDWLEK